jgi:hypothetical protein
VVDRTSVRPTKAAYFRGSACPAGYPHRIPFRLASVAQAAKAAIVSLDPDQLRISIITNIISGRYMTVCFAPVDIAGTTIQAARYGKNKRMPSKFLH